MHRSAEDPNGYEEGDRIMTDNFEHINVRNLTIDDIIERMYRLCRDPSPLVIARRSRSSTDPILGSSTASTARTGYYSSPGPTWDSLPWPNWASVPAPPSVPTAPWTEPVPGTSSSATAFVTGHAPSPGTSSRTSAGTSQDSSARDPLPGTSRNGQSSGTSPRSIYDASSRSSNDPSSGPSCSFSTVTSNEPSPRSITGRSFALPPTNNPLPRTTSNPLPRSVNWPPLGNADRRCTFYPEFKKPPNPDPVELSLEHIPPSCERNEPAPESQPSSSDVYLPPFIRAQIHGFSAGDGNAEDQCSRWALYPRYMPFPRLAPVLRSPLGLTYGRTPRSIYSREYVRSEYNKAQKEKLDYERKNAQGNKKTSKNNESGSKQPKPLKFDSKVYKKTEVDSEQAKKPEMGQKAKRSDNAGKKKRKKNKGKNKKKNGNTNQSE